MHKFDDIIPPSRRRESEPLSQSLNKETRSSRGGSGFPYATVLVVIVVIGASIASLLYFSSAKIEIVPNSIAATVDASLTASQSTGDLPFKVIVAKKVASQSVKGGVSKAVTAFASGTITIYNTQAKPQALRATTRFATPAGLVYRIRDAVTVPGGSVAKPGSVSAKVFADQSGSSYNVGPSTFVLPALVGKPEASQVYARSTVALSGGASGTVPTVDPVAGAQARTALTTALAPDLEKSIKDQIPAGYVLVPGAAVTTYQDLDAVPSATEGMIELKVQGTINAVVFPNAALAKSIASSSTGTNYQGESLTIVSTDALKVVPTSGVPDEAATSFSFTLSGNASLVYTVDKARIAAAVAGKTRSAAEVALTNYPEINKAIIVLRPFWKQAFPEDPAAIAISVSAE